MSQVFDKQFILQFVGKLETAVEVATSQTMLEIYGIVVKLSPVDTGRFRGNWIYSQGQPSDQIRPFNKYSNSVIPIQGLRIEARLSNKKAHHLVNNLPYAQRLEEGHSKQAPAGIVAPIEPKIKAIFEARLQEALA